MADDDRVAVYEAGVVSCHGAPQRDCCVRAGLDAHEQLVREQVARQLSPAMLAARTAIPDGRIQRGCIVQDGAIVRERLREAWLAIRNPEPSAPEAEGWGARLRHGASDPRDLDPPVPSRCGHCGAWGGHHTAHCPLDHPTIGRPPSQESP